MLLMIDTARTLVAMTIAATTVVMIETTTWLVRLTLMLVNSPASTTFITVPTAGMTRMIATT